MGVCVSGVHVLLVRVREREREGFSVVRSSLSFRRLEKRDEEKLMRKQLFSGIRGHASH